MSNAALQGGAGGTGTVTLVAPSTSTDRTLTLPDATGTVMLTNTVVQTAQFDARTKAAINLALYNFCK